MRKKKKKTLDQILPEGLSESAVKEITGLMQDVINEQVEEKVKLLEARVTSFVRANIDSLKEQAVKELELENDTFHNAQLFETVKSIMAVELDKDDEDSAVKILANESRELEGEMGLLSNELDRVLKENSKMQAVISALSDKTDMLDEERNSLLEVNSHLENVVETLEESNKKPFKSSERAMVVSENNVGVQRTGDNEFLTEDVMKFMP